MTRRLDSKYVDSSTTFQMTTPQKIVYGVGAASRLPDVLGPQVLEQTVVITDEVLVRSGVVTPVLETLGLEDDSKQILIRESREPTAGDMERLATEARHLSPQTIIAIGGGSTIDSAKALRLLLTFGGSLSDYEGPGRVPGPSDLTLAALPTTSGTGSEMTGGAVYTDEQANTKTAVGSHHLIADAAIVDPLLTMTAPPGVTTSTGLDALTQAMGTYHSPFRHPMTDTLSMEASRLLYTYLVPASRNGNDIEARCGMAYGSMLMGQAMANAECTGEHLFGEIIGPRYGIPHGYSVALFFPYILQFNRETSEQTLGELSRAVLPHMPEDNSEAIDKLIQGITNLIDDLAVPSLAEFGIKAEDLDELSDRVMEHYGIPEGLNPRVITKSDCLQILKAAFDGIDPLMLPI